MQTIRQGIITNVNVREILFSGNAMVDDIVLGYKRLRDATEKLSSFQLNGIRGLKEVVDGIEGEIAFEIKDDKTLKNADQRKIAIAKKLVSMPSWRQAKETLRVAEETEAKLKLEKTTGEDNVKILRYYLSVWQSRMVVIAGLSNEQQEHRITTSANVTIGGNNAEETD